MRINKSLITQTTGGGGSGSVTSVGLSVTTPTGLTQSVTGSPVTSSGTLSLALSFTAGYGIPTTIKQSNWDDAYTWVSAFPTQTGNADKVLYTNGTNLSWSKVFTSTISATGSPNSSTFLRGDGVWSTPTGFSNPMTTLGDTIYGDASGVATRLAGNITTTRRFLMSQGSGVIAAAPIWDAVTKTDVGLGSVENTALSTWAGSANITTLGTITTGTWTATTIAVARGGTGATTLTGVVIGTGTTAMTAVAGTASQLLRRNAGNTAYEFFTPTYISAAITSLGGLSVATQTFANDTNVTITSATSTHTLGWTGQLSIARGGTNASTAVAAFDNLAPTTTLGDIIFHNGTDNVRLAGNITPAKQFLSQTGTSSTSAAPAWSAVTKSDVGLANVENTALSTWAGSANITTVGTISSGTWGGTAISIIKGGTGLTSLGTANQILRVNALGTALEYANGTNATITLSGDVTGSGTTAITTTIASLAVNEGKIANNAVTFAKMQQISTASFLGRSSAGAGNIENFTGTVATSLLDLFGTNKGLVPSSSGFTNSYYLSADGQWRIPTGPNIYNADGFLSGNRTVDGSIYSLTISGSPSSASTNPFIVKNANTSGLNTTACLALDTGLVGSAVDIRFGSTNPYALRMYASNANLTTTPVGAGFQLFSTSSASFPGHVYFDSGANDNATINFRTAPSLGTISTRMSINANGQLKLNTYTAITSWSSGVVVGYLAFTSTGDIVTSSGTTGGSTSVSIGQSVTGGLANNMLYVSASQTLAQTANFTINGSGNFQVNDAYNIEFGTTTGTILGLTSSQKLSFWGNTPIVRPSTTVASATFALNTGTTINASSTFDGYTLGQVVKALRNIGLLN